MKNSRINPASLVIATLSGATVVGLGALGATAADTTPTTSASSSAASSSSSTSNSESGKDFKGGRGERGGRGFDTAALAKELGVSESKLQAAMQATRPTEKPTRDGSRPTEAERTAEQATRDAALAKELGISQEKVTAAFTKLRSAHEAQEKSDLSTRLTEAVSAGKLTEADKASVLKAFDAGVLGGPGRH